MRCLTLLHLRIRMTRKRSGRQLLHSTSNMSLAFSFLSITKNKFCPVMRKDATRPSPVIIVKHAPAERDTEAGEMHCSVAVNLASIAGC